MIALQKPRFVYMSGRLRPWDDATLHVGCEGATGGLNVLEGVKGYWSPAGHFGIIMLPQHYARLCRSARLLHIPFDMPYEEFEGAIHALAAALLDPAQDMWFRTTLFVTEGH